MMKKTISTRFQTKREEISHEVFTQAETWAGECVLPHSISISDTEGSVSQQSRSHAQRGDGKEIVVWYVHAQEPIK